MKKTILLVALMGAALVAPGMPAVAADAMAKPSIEAECFILPLLPDCVAAIEAEASAHGWSMTAIPAAWWHCKKAEANAGHLLDCAA